MPYNYIALAVFTICEAYVVSFCCGAYSPDIVLAAAFMTAAMVVALTVYAFVTKTDFTVCGGTLFIVSVTMMMFGIFVIFTTNYWVNMIWCSIGVILFGVYLVFDT